MWQVDANICNDRLLREERGGSARELDSIATNCIVQTCIQASVHATTLPPHVPETEAPLPPSLMGFAPLDGAPIDFSIKRHDKKTITKRRGQQDPSGDASGPKARRIGVQHTRKDLHDSDSPLRLRWHAKLVPTATPQSRGGEQRTHPALLGVEGHGNLRGRVDLRGHGGIVRAACRHNHHQSQHETNPAQRPASMWKCYACCSPRILVTLRVLKVVHRRNLTLKQEGSRKGGLFHAG